MKYLKIVITLIFVAVGAVVYFSNRGWMDAPAVIGFGAVPFREIMPVATTTGMALLAAFLLGMIFALTHSSLNWMELIGKNRKIRKLEKEMGKEGEEGDGGENA